MASQITDVITSLKTKIKALPYTWPDGFVMTFEGKLFQNVAVWNNQIKQWKQGKGFPNQKPCCYIELNLGKAASMGLGISFYENVCIKLHIVDWQINTGTEDGDNILDENLEVYGYRDLLKTWMARFFPLHCGLLNMIDEEQDYEHAGIYHYIIEFKTSFADLQGSILNPDQTDVILTAPPTDSNPYDPTASYTIGKKVGYQDAYYICIEDTPVPAGDFDPALWDAFTPKWGYNPDINIVEQIPAA